MTDIKDQNNNEDFKNFLLRNSKNIKEQGADFMKSIHKIVKILNDEQITAILKNIKNG